MLDKKQQEQLRARKRLLEEWLDECCPYAAVDQKHLDDGTPEQAYWHLGYMAALADIFSLIDKSTSDSGHEKLN